MIAFKLWLNLTLIILIGLQIINCDDNEEKDTEESIKNYLIVETKNGHVRGEQLTTLFNKKVYRSFKGIPFAKPPINDLRFKVMYSIILFSIFVFR